MLLILANLSNISVIIFVLVIGGISGAMFGANSMLLGAIPMKYAKNGRASSTAGFLDFSSYVAAGISATAIGLLANTLEWTVVIIVWISVAILGAILIAISKYYDNVLCKDCILIDHS